VLSCEIALDFALAGIY